MLFAVRSVARERRGSYALLILYVTLSCIYLLLEKE